MRSNPGRVYVAPAGAAAVSTADIVCRRQEKRGKRLIPYVCNLRYRLQGTHDGGFGPAFFNVKKLQRLKGPLSTESTTRKRTERAREMSQARSQGPKTSALFQQLLVSPVS